MAFGLFAFLECVPAPSQAPLNAYIASNVGVSGTLEGPVTAVASQSPATLGFTATSPNRPVWKDARFSGGKPSIHFPDSEVDYLTASSKLVCPDGFSCFVVFKTDGTDTVTSNANINPPMTILGDHNTTNSRNQLGLSGGNVRYCYKVGGTTWTTYSGSGDTLNDGNVHTIAVIHKTDGSLSVYTDGVLRISETGVTYDASQTGINRIGAGYNSQDPVQNFDLAELKVWNGAIEAGSVASLHASAIAYWSSGAVPVVLGINYDVIDIAGGGQRVVVQVDSSTGCTGITIGGVACTSFAIDDGTHVSGIPGAHAAGVVDVIVTNAAGPSTTGTGLVEYWSPAQLATGSKDTFLDANKGITLASGKVSAWASQGTTARSFAQGTAGSQPAQTASAFGTMPGITFDGVDDFLSTSIVGPVDGWSIFVVAKWTSSDATATQAQWNVPLSMLGYSGGWNGFGASAGQIAFKKHDKPIVTRASGLNDGSPHLIGATSPATTPAIKVYLGDVQQGATESPGGVSTIYYERIGAGYSGDLFAGHIGAALAVEGVISGANVTRCRKWAQQRYAVDVVAAPSITSLSYSQFATDGIGKPVTVTGTNLSGATKVTISGVDITPTSSTSTTVVFTPPARTAASSLSLTVTTPGGASNALTCSYWGPEAASVTALHDFDPADASKRTLVSGKVSVLLDRIGAMHMRQATDANRPTLVSSDAAYGGVDTLSHSSSYLIGDATTAISGPVSILVIGNTTAGSQCLISKDTNTAPYDIIHSSGVRPRFYSNAGNLTASTGATVSSPSAVLFTDSMSGSSAANLYNVDLSTPLASGTTRWGSITALAIGLGIAGLTNLTGKIARVIVWGGVLSADDKAKLADYLNNARGYGLSVTASAPSFAVTSISPTSGTERGGTSVTITGTGFTGATSASVGGLTLDSFTVVNSTTITGTTKMQTPGAKNVVVTNGTTATLTSGYTVNEVGLYTSGVKFRGINRAGPEYGEDWPGWTGQTYYEIPSGSVLTAEIAHFKAKGFNIIRLPFSWVRMQHTLGGSLHAGYSAAYKTLVETLTNAGFRVIVDCHAYMRYATGVWSGETQVGTYDRHTIGDGTVTNAHLVDLWSKVAALFVGNHYVQFGLMNEPHGLPFNSTTLFSYFNAQIAAIRSAGAKQLILVSNSEGSEVTHWNTWSPNGGPLDSVAALDIVDSENNYAFEHHCYISDPGATDFSSALATITNWSRTNGKKAILTEGFMHNNAAGGSTAWNDLMTYLNANNDVWIGITPWNLDPHTYISQDGGGATVVDTAAMAWYSPFLTPNKVT